MGKSGRILFMKHPLKFTLLVIAVVNVLVIVPVMGVLHHIRDQIETRATTDLRNLAWSLEQTIDTHLAQQGLAAAIDPSHMTSRLAGLHLDAQAYIELRDERLGLLARYPTPALATGRTANDSLPAPFANALRHQPDEGQFITDGMLNHYRRLTRAPLYLNIVVAQADVLGPWHQGIRAALIGLSFFALASLLAGMLLVHAWQRHGKTARSLSSSRQALQDSETRWRKIFDQSPIGAAVATPQGQLLNVNETLCRLLDTPRDVLLTKRLDELMPTDEARINTEHIQQLLTGQNEHFSRESRCLNHQGEPLWVHLSMSLSHDSNGAPQHLLPIFQDIGATKEAQAQINFLAFHDALTGLPNRELAKDRLDHAIAYATRVNSGIGLLHLDLDHFQAINDSLGHPVGDALLKKVAAKLLECVRDTDTVSRLGGDEFLIILANVVDPEIISSIAVKVQEKLASTFKIGEHELTTSVSIGIAVYPDDGKDFDMLLKKADTALYKAKEHGRNNHQFYTEQMNSEAVEYLKIRNGLRQALINDEFLLHYQPQINLADGRVVGVESLIRWRHPELGILQPGRFISIAEDSGLIVPIGDWVLKAACRQAVEWQRAGLPDIVVAVNLSAVQFRRGDIEKSVLQALSESGLEPQFLELELTESILIQDADKALDTLHRLKAMGMKLSIDDFGTGYSSLSYLKRFNVDKLKIDQSFVRDMANNRNDAAIVQAIIQMARSLNLQVIAEGVEDENLAALLHSQQCNEAQGYHYARPLAPAAFADYMKGLNH
jgi:diguanylate cyclase (GGDEF)-like protein/PAS domain S-box-containing protein